MRVSIITVCFNSERSISDTLQSVAAQSHPDIEHIVIDGASKDATLDIVRAEGTHVATLISEPDKGIYDAMNKGLRVATGDLIGFLNADDVFNSNDCVARMVECCQRDQVDAVYGDLLYVQEADTSKVIRYWQSGWFSRAALGKGWMPPHPTFYIRRQLLDMAGSFNTRYRIAADYDFMLRCLLQPTVAVGYVPLALVRMRTGGASNRSLRAMLRKSREDLHILHSLGVGGVSTLLAKNFRKLPQFFAPASAYKD